MFTTAAPGAGRQYTTIADLYNKWKSAYLATRNGSGGDNRQAYSAFRAAVDSAGRTAMNTNPTVVMVGHGIGFMVTGSDEDGPVMTAVNILHAAATTVDA